MSDETAKKRAEPYTKIVEELPEMRWETIDLVRNAIAQNRRSYVLVNRWQCPAHGTSLSGGPSRDWLGPGVSYIPSPGSSKGRAPPMPPPSGRYIPSSSTFKVTRME